jgi:hypothetical protein
MSEALIQTPAADAISTTAWSDGIQINELEKFDTLSVETLHHTYEITVMNPETAEVLITGGDYFHEPTSACVLGASLHSSIKMRGIYVGFKIELWVDGKCIITSRVRSIRRHC